MKKEDALKKLSALEKEAAELRIIIETPEKNNYEGAKTWLLDYLSKPFEVELQNEEITYYRDGKWIFILDLKNKYLWCYSYEVWEIFEKDFGLKYEEIRALHRDVVCKALNCKEFTPYYKKKL